MFGVSTRHRVQDTKSDSSSSASKVSKDSKPEKKDHGDTAKKPDVATPKSDSKPATAFAQDDRARSEAPPTSAFAAEARKTSSLVDESSRPAPIPMTGRPVGFDLNPGGFNVNDATGPTASNNCSDASLASIAGVKTSEFANLMGREPRTHADAIDVLNDLASMGARAPRVTKANNPAEFSGFIANQMPNNSQMPISIARNDGTAHMVNIIKDSDGQAGVYDPQKNTFGSLNDIVGDPNISSVDFFHGVADDPDQMVDLGADAEPADGEINGGRKKGKGGGGLFGGKGKGGGGIFGRGKAAKATLPTMTNHAFRDRTTHREGAHNQYQVASSRGEYPKEDRFGKPQAHPTSGLPHIHHGAGHGSHATGMTTVREGVPHTTAGGRNIDLAIMQRFHHHPAQEPNHTERGAPAHVTPDKLYGVGPAGHIFDVSGTVHNPVIEGRNRTENGGYPLSPASQRPSYPHGFVTPPRTPGGTPASPVFPHQLSQDQKHQLNYFDNGFGGQAFGAYPPGYQPTHIPWGGGGGGGGGGFGGGGFG